MTTRLLHYNAIKIASDKINSLYQDGKDFFTRKINDEFIVTHKLVINANFNDLLNTYLKIEQNRKKINFHLEKDQLFSVEDGNKWLNYFLNSNKLDWDDLFNYIPRDIKSLILKKSAIVSIL